MLNKHLLISYSILAATCWLAACSSSSTTLPNTPESVARQWQNHVDNNEFTKAKELSAPTAIEWLDWVSETLTEDILEKDTLPPGKILDMSCVENGHKADCAYSFDDNGFVYEDTFKLLKIKGQWLVDIPVENLIEGDDIEHLLEQMKQEIEDPQKATE